MTVIADTHTHTSACFHAYSSLTENARAASDMGLKFLAITEHGPSMIDGPHEWFFHNIMNSVPDVLFDVVLLKGAEANIMDYEGNLDIPKVHLAKLDWVIASYHAPCIEIKSEELITQGWLNVAKNPDVDVIGHAGDGRFFCDYERIVKAFAEYGKIVEINSHSFVTREGSSRNCLEIAKLCKKYGVKIVVSSDAHFWTRIGQVQPSLDLLKSIDYPEDLILNTEYERFLQVAREKTGRNLIEI